MKFKAKFVAFLKETLDLNISYYLFYIILEDVHQFSYSQNIQMSLFDWTCYNYCLHGTVTTTRKKIHIQLHEITTGFLILNGIFVSLLTRSRGRPLVIFFFSIYIIVNPIHSHTFTARQTVEHSKKDVDNRIRECIGKVRAARDSTLAHQ